MLEEAIVDRIKDLLDMADAIESDTKNASPSKLEVFRPACSSWIAEAYNLICQACPKETHPYRVVFERTVIQQLRLGNEHLLVDVGSAQLLSMWTEDEAGLLASVADQASAEAFGDLLDHATEYHANGSMKGSSILATAVFEDTLRRIAKSKAIAVKGMKLDAAISSLVRAGTINKIMSKKCRTAAGVRNAALHASWDEFSLGDAEDVIELTRQLIKEHLVE